MIDASGEAADRQTFIRSRPVARDFREEGDKRAGLYAATPSLHTLILMLALSFLENLRVMVVDVKKAHLNGVVKPEDWNHYAQAVEERRSLGRCWT